MISLQIVAPLVKLMKLLIFSEFRQNRFVLFAPFLRSSFVSSWRYRWLDLALYIKTKSPLVAPITDEGVAGRKQFPECIQLSVWSALNSFQTLLFSPKGLKENCLENSCFRRFLASIQEARIWNLFSISKNKRRKVNQSVFFSGGGGAVLSQPMIGFLLNNNLAPIGSSLISTCAAKCNNWRKM